MASAKFLEEALSTDVDESAVNALVGSLETQLVTTQITTQHDQQGINVSSANQNNNNCSAIVSNGGPIVTSQKHGVANGELISSVINNNNNSSVIFNSDANKSSSNGKNNNNNNNQFVVNNQVTVRQQPHLQQHSQIQSQNQKTFNLITSGSSNLNNSVIYSSFSQTNPQNSLSFSTTSSSSTSISTSNMPKSNEPIKLVYPTVGGGGNAGGAGGGNQTTAVLNMNNRVTFTSQPLPNGSISLSPLTQTQPATMMHTSTSAGGTTTVRTTSQPQQTLVIKNQVSMPGGISSSGPGIVTMTKTLNQSGNQNLVGSQMLPASVQIVNMRPGTPTNQNQQKMGNTQQARVLIGGPTQLVGARPQNQAITLSSLQNIPQGQTGSALLLKTESGQYQLLRVGPAPAQQNVNPNMVSSGNQTIRLQTVPAVSRFTGPPLTLRKTIVTQQQVKQKPQNQQGITTSTGTIIVNSSVASTVAPSHVLTTSSTGPPVAFVAPVPALTPQNTTTVQQQQQQQRATPDKTKEKCRKFLANVLVLAKRESKPVERNVTTLMQELIDAVVEPEEFCERLERLLNAIPQPCLIGFLKKSLPSLRQSLVKKEVVIDGISPPPPNVAFPNTATTITTQIPAQMRQIGQTVVTSSATIQPASITVPNNQIRMMTPSGTTIRPGQTTITRHQTPVRIQGPLTATAPRLGNASSVSQIRPGTTTVVQTTSSAINQQLQQLQQQHMQQQQQQSTTPPALQPVSVTNINPNVIIPAAQIRTPTTITRPQTQVQVRATAPIRTTNAKGANVTTIKVGQTQIKQITGGQIPVTAATPIVVTSTQSPVVVHQQQQQHQIHQTPLPTPPPPTPIATTLPTAQTITTIATATTTVIPTGKTIVSKVMSGTAQSQKAAKEIKEKEKKVAATAASFYQTNAISMSSSMYGDDDINDVAAMGGVNLAEETQRIMGSTELIGTQIRSCKDEVFLHMPALQSRIRQIIARHGLEEPSNEVAVLISHATQERLKNVVEKLAVIAEHRIDVIKIDPRYEITKDVRGQIKFLEELDKAEQKRHEEQEREMLLRAAKSRSKTEDPEQAKLKAKAKEMQRAEMEELRQRDANLTALQAIGPRKKPRLDGDTTVTSLSGSSGTGTSGLPSVSRPRIKRVNLRDMLFYLEQERETCRSSMLYKAYLK